MNLLIDLVPDTVNIDGEKYKINSDFRYSILFELLMQDKTLSDKEKIVNALSLYYPVCPENINEAINQMLLFYRCGKDIELSKGKGKGKSDIQIYNFEYDDEYIYAAFMDQYGIDLQDIEELHWWKFKAMFKSLKEDNEIVKIMQYRSVDLSNIKDKEEKAYYRKMKELHKIPVSQSEKQKLNEIEKVLLDGGDISKLL